MAFGPAAVVVPLPLTAPLMNMEFQAEAAAYLSMHELGRLDDGTASESRGYIQHWLHDERPSDRESPLVFAATDQILKAGQLAVSGIISADAEQ